MSVYDHELAGSQHDDQPQLSDEDKAFLHAESEWNVFRTVPIGAAHWYGNSGVLASATGETPGTEPGFSIAARATRVTVTITNLATANGDFLTVNSGGNYPAKGGIVTAAVAACGAGYVLQPGKDVTIATRGPVFITAPVDAVGPVPFAYIETFD